MVPRMLACLSACLAVPAVGPAAEANPAGPAATPPFGFSGIEIYKLDQDVSRLRAHDVNGDGLTDLVVVNNTRATIDFFIEKKPDEIAASEAKPLEYDNINEIASDARFRKESLLTEKRVFDLVVEDLNGDGRADLAYYGDPKELVIVQGSPEGWSSAPRKFPIPEARAFGRGLSAGDLNGDGKPDLALLGGEKTYLFFQDENGKMLEPREVPNSEKSLSSLAAADVSGDGTRDLVLAGGGLVEPIRHPAAGTERPRSRGRPRDCRLPLPPHQGPDLRWPPRDRGSPGGDRPPARLRARGEEYRGRDAARKAPSLSAEAGRRSLAAERGLRRRG